jgi:hypothetical protein
MLACSARQAGFDQLIEFIRERSEGAAVLIAGDTNLHRDDPEDLAILDKLTQEADVQDVCEYLDCGIDKIDRFFFRGNASVELEPTAWRIATEFVDETGLPLSDHDAIRDGGRAGRMTRSRGRASVVLTFLMSS